MKRLTALFVIAVMLAGAMAGFFSTTVSAESLYIKKIVSVVYDDSSSMLSGQKWANANYAMQMFCGLLNETDELYITYMSDAMYHEIKETTYDPEKVDLSSGRIRESVEKIRNRKKEGGIGTPYETIQIAFDKLKSIPSSERNTQYWLVVITDGEFVDYSFKSNGDVSSMREIGSGELFGKLQEYTGETMPNNSRPNVSYFAIGGSAPVPSGGAYAFNAYHAADAKTIIAKMSEIACEVSGRTDLKKSDIKVSGNQIEVNSELPLLNIVVLLQGENATITDVGVNGKRLGSGKPVRSADIWHPDDPSLKSSVFLIDNGRDKIDKGKYVITLDNNTKPEDVSVLFEPAIDILKTIKVNGQTVDDLDRLDDLANGDVLSVSFKIVEAGTEKELDPNLLKNIKTTYSVTVEDDAGGRASGEMGIKDYTLKNAKTVLDIKVEIPGFKPLGYHKVFTPKALPSYKISAKPVKSPVKSEKLNDLVLEYEVLKDGAALRDKAEVESLQPVITQSGESESFKPEITGDGLIRFTPKAGDPRFGKEDYQVTVVCTLQNTPNKAKAESSFTITAPGYRLEAFYAADKKEIKSYDLAGNKDVSLGFRVYKDDALLTDKAAVEALLPVVTQSGESGNYTPVINDKGEIIFTPTASKDARFGKENYQVTVACTLQGTSNKAFAEILYTVIAPGYRLEAFNDGSQEVKSDGLSGLGIWFRAYKDDVQIESREEVEKLLPVITQSDENRNFTPTVGEDGVIRFAPTSSSDPRFGKEDYEVTVRCTLQNASNKAFAEIAFKILGTVYSIEASFEKEESIRQDKLPSNGSLGDKDLILDFRIFADGEPLGKEQVEKLQYSIVYADGISDGFITVKDDGTIAVTPTKAGKSYGGVPNYDVTVTCAVGGTETSLTYKVLIAQYVITVREPEDPIVKTEFFGNETGASYEIYEDGVKLNSDGIAQKVGEIDGNRFSFNQEHEDLKLKYEISPDGVISIVPYSEEEYTLTFLSWWINWAKYFSVSGEDLRVTFTCGVGSADAVIKVCEKSVGYILFAVVAPLLLEVILLALLVMWILMIVFKPKYTEDAKLFVGDIRYDDGGARHVITNFRKYDLKKYNGIKYGRLKFKWSADVVNVGGVRIRAERGGTIRCEMKQSFPWFKGRLNPEDSGALAGRSLDDILDYFERNHKKLFVEEFVMNEKVSNDFDTVMTSAQPNSPKFTVIPLKGSNGTAEINGRKVIKAGKIMVYC